MNNDRFERLKYPVHQFSPEHDLSKEPRFKILFNYPEFKHYAEKDGPKRKYLNKLVRYICFLYDPHSELQDEFPNLTERKEAAAIEAGFTRNKSEEFPKIVQDIFDFTDLEAVAMILRFLKHFKSYLWTEIATQEHELEKYTAMRWLNDDTNAQKLLLVCQNIRKSLDENKKEFFDGDTNLQKKVIEMITPENAHRIFADEIAAQYDVSSN